MPQLMVRNASEVPRSIKSSRAVREQQQQYERFITQLDGNVGELHLEPQENTRSVKVRLRRAATRLSQQIDIRDMNGLVYFKSEGPKSAPKRERKPAAK